MSGTVSRASSAAMRRRDAPRDRRASSSSCRSAPSASRTAATLAAGKRKHAGGHPQRNPGATADAAQQCLRERRAGHGPAGRRRPEIAPHVGRDLAKLGTGAIDRRVVAQSPNRHQHAELPLLLLVQLGGFKRLRERPLDRNPGIGRFWKREPGRHDADHPMIDTVDEEQRADDARIGRKPRSPERVAENDRRWVRREQVLAVERASDLGRRRQAWKRRTATPPATPSTPSRPESWPVPANGTIPSRPVSRTARARDCQSRTSGHDNSISSRPLARSDSQKTASSIDAATAHKGAGARHRSAPTRRR